MDLGRFEREWGLRAMSVAVNEVGELVKRARRSGWVDGDLEVNIDHTNGRWRELDWAIEPYLERL